MTLLEQARDLKHQRMTLVKANRDLTDKAEKEKRDFSAEEQTEYDKRFAEIGTLTKRAERLEAEDAQSRDFPADPEKPAGGKPEPRDKPTTREFRYKLEPRAGVPERERVFRAAADPHAELRAAAFRSHLETGRDNTPEIRALEATSPTGGGYTVAPIEWQASLIQAVDNQTFMRGLATVQTVTSAAAVGRPSLDADPADPTWTTELLVGDEDSTMAFGARELSPNPLAELLKVSKKLLRASMLNIESLVRERLAYKVSVKQEAAFMTGNGAGQPLGVFTASASGISTGRDVSTDNTTTAFTVDGLKNAKYSIKGQYWPRLRWVFHRDAVKMLAKLKDGEGQYLWQPSIVAGQPDRLETFPVLMSEYAPNTFTTGLYVGILGDFSNYWIVDALGMTVERLDELYAATNQVGFILRAELDAMPTLEEAFARVKLA